MDLVGKLAEQVPALLVLVWLTTVFLRTVRERDVDFQKAARERSDAFLTHVKERDESFLRTQTELIATVEKIANETKYMAGQTTDALRELRAAIGRCPCSMPPPPTPLRIVARTAEGAD